MAKQFDDDQVAVLQRIILEHEYGLGPGTGEVFAPTQKPLSYDELAEMRKVINERMWGVDGGFGPSGRPLRQDLLSHDELAEFRKILRERSRNRASDLGRAAAKSVSDGLLETFLPPRPKTSALLTDAANMIGDAMVVNNPKRLPIFMGKDWGPLVAQLRERAAAFKTVEDVP